jgi:hypothetical protein
MIPFGNQMVTLIKRVESIDGGKTKVSYSRHLLIGCSWREKTSWYQAGTEMLRTTEITCRIPYDLPAPASGDYLFLGDVQIETDNVAGINKVLQAHSPRAFRVASVANNALSGFPLPHYIARGNAP